MPSTQENQSHRQSQHYAHHPEEPDSQQAQYLAGSEGRPNLRENQSLRLKNLLNS